MKVSRSTSVWAGVGQVFAFVFTFGLTCWVIRLALPFPPVPVVHAKLAHLSRHIDDYDTLFIGSSRIYRHIVPSVFDPLMAQKGVPTRSFNAGVDGMAPPEDAYVMDRILTFGPKDLRYVFVELGALSIRLDEDKQGTIRLVYWHDWERLAALFQRAIYQKKKRDLPDLLKALREPLGEFSGHLELFLQNMTNTGRGETVMSALRERNKELPARASIGKREDGYVVANLPQEMSPVIRAEYERSLEERRRKPATNDLSDPASQKALERMVARIEQIGATPVLIVPPTTNKKNFVPTEALARRVMVLDFSDVTRFPALFENHHRQDTNHVNGAGAIVFTRYLVEEFAARTSGR